MIGSAVTRFTPFRRRPLAALGAAGAAVLLVFSAACTERLESGIGCPSLCPDQNVAVLDTILDVVSDVPGSAGDSAALDTTLVGFPGIGNEATLLLADRVLNGVDTLRTWAVIRFDSLPRRFARGATDSAVYAIDSVYLQVLVDTVSARRRVSGPVTLEVFDVDAGGGTATDTMTSTLAPFFRADRLIGSRTFTDAELRDSVKIPLSNAFVLGKLTAEGVTRIRVGLRADAGGAPVQLRIGGTSGGRGAELNYDPSPDTAVRPTRIVPYSSEPIEVGGLQNALRDFTLVLDPFRAEPNTTLQVGGLPGRRAFLRFRIPPNILDSSTVIRATLLLTQRRDPRAAPSDTVTVQPTVVLATPRVDVVRSTSLLDFFNRFSLDSLRLVSGDSVVHSIEMINVIRGVVLPTGEFQPGWSQLPRAQQQHALVLRSIREGELPVEALFYSSEAAAALRPRLRLSYVPASRLGTR